MGFERKERCIHARQAGSNSLTSRALCLPVHRYDELQRVDIAVVMAPWVLPVSRIPSLLGFKIFFILKLL